MRSRAATLLALAGAVAIFAAALVLSPPAHAWTVTAPVPNVFEVNRESTDATGSGSITFYATGSNPSSAQLSGGSWDSTASGGTFYGATAQVIAFDPDDLGIAIRGYGPNVLFVLPNGEKMVCSYSPIVQPVYMATMSSSSQATWTVNASILGTVPTSQSGTATVSLGSTLPVDPWVTAGMPDGWQIGVIVVFMVIVAVHGSMMLGRSWRGQS